MKTITIYDYANAAKEINIPVENFDEILVMYVKILSGDETGIIILKDGTLIEFDASDERITGYDDGSYVVKGEDIEWWTKLLEEENTSYSFTKSYERQRAVIFKE